AYKSLRDRPDRDGTSRLSPYLHFGHVSPRVVWNAAHFAAETKTGIGAPVESFLRELLWREFSMHLLFHFPDMPAAPLDKRFRNFPWKKDAEALHRWEKGLTGYPIVDAGMRQLWQTGWMHNRVRMIVASFLIKHLRIDWLEGAAWFWDTLVDADLANNAASWQWVAGCGADAAPYFRIFNPVLQSRKFDPAGDYIRRFVPELAGLDAAHIHEPWKAPALLLRSAGVVLGKDYPHPMVEHAAARQQALDSYKLMKEEA
ncbi:MAG: deoxyribodipyrimidine photo-lyase, partial [Bdellovibrionales bacterium]